MSRVPAIARALWLSVWLAGTLMLNGLARADPPAIAIGYLSWDVTRPGASGQFDIVNLTGANGSGDQSWPVLTAVSLSELHLVVHFTNGAASTFDSSYFTLAPDGYSFDGSSLSISTGSPLPTDAVLTGVFSPGSVTLFDGEPVTLTSSFSAAISLRDGGLLDGDLQVIEAMPAVVTAVPEPGTASLLTIGLSVLLLARRRWSRRAVTVRMAVCTAMALTAVPALAAVKLAAWSAPSSGTAGSDYVNVTATGVALASGQTLQSATVTLAASCGASAVAVVPAASIKPIIAGSWRIQFLLPASLGSGTYAISIAGVSSDSSVVTAAGCAQVAVAAAPGGHWTSLIGRDWTLHSGSEGYKCVTLPITQDTYLSAFHAVMPPGSFRILATLSDTPVPTGAYDCNVGSTGNRGVFMSGPGGNDLELPAGAAVRLRAGQFLLLNLHLLNNSSETVQGTTVVQVRTVPAASVTALTELELVGTVNFVIPPDSAEHAYSGHCTATRSFDLLAMAPQMNGLGRQVQLTRTPATSSATADVLLDVPYSASSQLTYPAVPPAHIAAGDVVTATCKYRNTTGLPVTYGESVDAEQCFVGIYATPPSTTASSGSYPFPQPIYGCLAGSL